MYERRATSPAFFFDWSAQSTKKGRNRISERRQLRAAPLAVPLGGIVHRPALAALQRLVALGHVRDRIECAGRVPRRGRRIARPLLRHADREVALVTQVDDRLFARPPPEPGPLPPFSRLVTRRGLHGPGRRIHD